MKYIIIESEGGPRFPIAFPDMLIHADVAAVMCRLVEITINLPAHVVSAGSIAFGTDFTCSGGSDTLSLQSRPQDEAIIGVGEQAWAFPDAMLISLWGKAKKHKEAQSGSEVGHG